MNIQREILRQDLEEQFELPETPPPIKRLRAFDYRKPCAACEVATCRCIGWDAFEKPKR